MNVLCIPEIYTGRISWPFSVGLSVCLSVCLSVPLSWFLVSGRKTVRDIRTKFAEWIDSPGGRVLLHFSMVHDARGTWHAPPRIPLQKVVHAPTGQTEGTTDPKLAGYTYTTPTCVLLWLPLLWGARCTRQRRKSFLTWGPPV